MADENRCPNCGAPQRARRPCGALPPLPDGEGPAEAETSMPAELAGTAGQSSGSLARRRRSQTPR